VKRRSLDHGHTRSRRHHRQQVQHGDVGDIRAAEREAGKDADQGHAEGEGSVVLKLRVLGNGRVQWTAVYLSVALARTRRARLAVTRQLLDPECCSRPGHSTRSRQPRRAPELIVRAAQAPIVAVDRAGNARSQQFLFVVR
jgi:hypothetical protein